MPKLSLELLYAIGEILLLAAGTSVLSTVGIYIELLAVGELVSGDLVLGLWLGLFGGVVLYFGLYVIGFGEFRPRLRTLLTHQSE